MNLFKLGPERLPCHFNDKMKAKNRRDELNTLLASSQPGFIVMRGPDHWRGESFGRPLNQTVSSKRGW